jgi:hypothetical protein
VSDETVADLDRERVVYYTSRTRGGQRTAHKSDDCRLLSKCEVVFSRSAGKLEADKPLCQLCFNDSDFGTEPGRNVNETRGKLLRMDPEDAGLSPLGERDQPEPRTDGGTGTDDTDRVMVDTETLGIDLGSAILSIGAVRFGIDGLGEEFYREISLESCQEAGLEIDADTLEWWLTQDDAVADVLTGGESLYEILAQFGSWYQAHDFDEIWANSPSFDCEQLEVAFDAVGLTEPWEFRDERDVRTLRSLPCAVEIEMDRDEHDALNDAKYQARIVSETIRSLHTGGYDGD